MMWAYRCRGAVRALAPVAVWIAVGGCGASRSVTYELAGVESPDDVFACVEEAMKEDDWDVEYRNERTGRLVVSTTRRDIRRSNPTFQRGVDQLAIDVPTEDPGTIEVTARTFLEYFDRRGRTRTQIEPTPEIQAEARALLERCAPGGPEVEG